jgi:hypothetical protein
MKFANRLALIEARVEASNCTPRLLDYSEAAKPLGVVDPRQ